MIKLSIPLEGMTAEDLFVACVNGYKSESNRNRFLQVKHLVAADAAAYEDLVPMHPFVCSELPEGLGNEDMVRIYEGYLVDSKAPARHYYDAIKNHAWNNTCPYCGVNNVTTLDHYLPKSHYSTLVVAPVNLIPACMACNHKKRDDKADDASSAPIHAYLDEIPQGAWLHVELGPNMEVAYVVRCPETWDPVLCRRLENHVKKFELKRLYQNKAPSLIAERGYDWYEVLNESEEDLHKAISRERRGYERTDLNSWKSALLRGIEGNLKLLTAYLHKTYDS